MTAAPELSDLAARLGADDVLDVRTAVVDYPLEMITTGGRWWLTGTARHGGAATQVRLFVKLVRSARHSPVMAFVPPEFREVAVANLPWQVEPDVYGSEMAQVIPGGARMPALVAVAHPDDESAVLWLEAVEAADGSWDEADYGTAARWLGMLAASSEVGAVADRVGHVTAPRQARVYWEGRLQSQFAQAYRGEELWQHPVLAAHVPQATRDRLLGLLDAVPGLLAEIEELPLLSGHGDACPNNLLRTADGLVVIDWGFFGRHRVGFDLSQLVMSEIDLGHDRGAELPRRQRVCLDAFRAGLAEGGVEMSDGDLARAHAVQLALAAGISTIPVERLGEPPEQLAAHLAEQLVALDHILLPLGL